MFIAKHESFSSPQDSRLNELICSYTVVTSGDVNVSKQIIPEPSQKMISEASHFNLALNRAALNHN